ncbi:MAG TPA: hypothetical protein VGM20_07400 [Gemmatimonadales bacterium]|jgi:hypothetical protein
MSHSFRTLSSALVLSAAIALSAAAQGPRPDLSGTWVLDPIRSAASQFLPASAIYTIVQHGDTVTMDRQTSTTVGNVSVHTVEGVDGKVWKNTATVAGQTVEMSTTAGWSHDTLVDHSSGSLQGTEFSEDNRLSLSADKSTMTMLRTLHVGGQDVPLTMVFSKKP